MFDRFSRFTILHQNVGRSMNKIKHNKLNIYDLKSIHLSCLYYLYRENRPLTAKQICERCYEDKGAISRAVSYLQDKGYIYSSCKSDKKYNTLLFLTDRGKNISEDISKKLEDVLTKVKLDITDEELLLFYNTYEKIAKNLSTISDEDGL